MSLSSGDTRRLGLRSPWALPAAIFLVLIPVCAVAVAIVLSLRPQAGPTVTPPPCAGAVVACSGPAAPCCARWQTSGLRTEVDALAPDPARAGRLLAGTPSGLWASDDGGRTWQAQRALPPNTAVLALATGAGDGATFAGTGDGAVYARPSTGTGPWQPLGPPLGADPIFALAYNARSHTLLAGTVGGIYRGERRGATWRWQRVAHTGDSAVGSIIWLPSDPRRAYASVFGSSPPVLTTADGGRTWQPDTHGLPSALPSETLLPISSGAAGVLLTTMGDGVWLRGPDGVWRDVAAGLPERHAMPVVAGPGGVLYAGTMGRGVYEKRGAAPWRHLGTGPLDTSAAYTVLSLAYVGGAQPHLLAGTALGLFRYSLSS